MKYRSSTEIIDTILRSLDSGATRTRIMYKAYLSYSQLKEYLSLLQDKQLLKYEEGSQIYTITEKGLRFMNAYDDIRELVSGNTEESFQKDSPAEQADGDKKAELSSW
jgi:predicted transcriptional regulator